MLEAIFITVLTLAITFVAVVIGLLLDENRVLKKELGRKRGQDGAD